MPERWVAPISLLISRFFSSSLRARRGAWLKCLAASYSGN
jgi:hypothetical protein